MSDMARIISPVDGTLYAERPYLNHPEAQQAVERATEAQRAWQDTALDERLRILGDAVDALMEQQD